MRSTTAFILSCFMVFMGCSKGQRLYGWEEIECYDDGALVHADKWNLCPKFAGEGYSKLASGEIIKGECICRF